MQNNFNNLLKDLQSIADGEKAKILSLFFKTGKGEYGEGDIFWGITVPESRKIVQKYYNLSFNDLSKLIKNKCHEARLIALLILVHRYKISGNDVEKKKLYKFYLENTKYINNWDLVDLSAGYIVGDYLYDKRKERDILLWLARSKNIWERRIAIISTFAFIYKGESVWTFKIVDKLMKDDHDLIHKACGWMLREVGKRVSEKELTKFLDKYATKMPRTMLRYSIERLPEKKRKYYLYKTK